jgi:hypothetical protein
MNRPRPSLLELFDPLAGALCVPLPESPPISPLTSTKSLETKAEGNESAIDELTTSAFFKQVSQPIFSSSKNMCTSTPEPLINFGEIEEVELGAEGPKVSSMSPLTMIMDDDIIPSPPQSKCRSISAHAASSINSPMSRSQQYSPRSEPSISVTNFSDNDDPSLAMMTHSIQPTYPREAPLTKESGEDVGLMRSRRRSSIDIATVSAHAFASLRARDASFDLLNGESSFLESKGFEDEDIYQNSIVRTHTEYEANEISQQNGNVP